MSTDIVTEEPEAGTVVIDCENDKWGRAGDDWVRLVHGAPTRMWRDLVAQFGPLRLDGPGVRDLPEGESTASTDLTAVAEPFNWHELDRDSFLSWLVVHVIAGDRSLSDRVSEASDKFQNVALAMQINGVEVNAVEFTNRVKSNMTYWSERRARELVSESTAFPAIEDALDVARRSIEDTLRRQLREAGVEWLED